MCWKYNGTKNKKGDITVGDIKIARNLNQNEYAIFIKKKAEEAVRKGRTLEEHLKIIAKGPDIFVRKATKLEIKNLEKLRKLFHAGWKKNVAYTEGKIGNELINLKSRSGKPKGLTKNFDNFKIVDVDNYHYLDGPISKRLYDSEQKQIEYLYNKFKNNKNISGRIEVVSDLIICPNCNYIIDKFNRDFPNIEVVKIWNRNALTP